VSSGIVTLNVTEMNAIILSFHPDIVKRFSDTVFSDSALKVAIGRLGEVVAITFRKAEA